MDGKKTLNLNLFLVKLKAILSTFILVLFVSVGFFGCWVILCPIRKRSAFNKLEFPGLFKRRTFKNAQFALNDFGYAVSGPLFVEFKDLQK